MRIKKLIVASAAAMMLASNQTAMAGVSYAAETVAESQIVYGEVNGDGKVSLSDAVAILQYIANRDKYPLSSKALLNADCVDHGDGVTGMDALALKLIDANMLKAEDLPVTSQKIQECLNPPTSEEALLFDEVYTFGVYNTETKTIDIEWLVNETVKEVEIFVSDDNQKYVSVAKVKDEAKYSYEVKEDFDTKFFKVSYTDKDGKLHESFPFFITSKDDKYVTEFFDTDEDGINDMFESAYGCKIDEADSDKDGLSDYEEIYFTQTDPSVQDSFKKGVSDADADCDEDGISNITEIKNGTNPIRKDTDYDGLTDLEEMNELKTNPLVGDTDEDGLSDYAERKMGLDPLKPETNGVPDAEVVLDQKIDSDATVLQAINEDENNKAYKLSVDIKTAGFAEDVVSVSKSRYTEVIDEESIIGDIVDIVADDTNLESMKLNFSICDEYKENTLGKYEGLEGIKRLTVFQYNEDIHMFIPMDTEYSESDGVVSAEINGTGTYCILDCDYWFDSIGIEAAENDTDKTEASDNETLVMSTVSDAVIGDDVSLRRNEQFFVIFTLQSAGDGEEGEKNFIYQKKMIHNIGNFLFKFYDGVYIFLVPYDVEVLNFNGTFGEWITDLTGLDNALDDIEYDKELGYADRWASYQMTAKIENFITHKIGYKEIVINLMNSKTEYNNYLGESTFVSSGYNRLFGQVYCKNKPAVVEDWFEFLDPSDNKTYNRKGLNVEFNPETNYDDILSFISRAVVKYNNYKVPTDVSNINVMLKDELRPNSDTDSDGDGIRDWDELDQNYVILNEDGSFSFMTYSDVFKKANISVGKNKEGNKLLQWDDTQYGPQLEEYYNNKTVAIWLSNPQLKDTDFDHIPDVDDNAPFDHIDTHFKVVDDYSVITHNDLMSNEYKTIYEKAKEEAPKDRINIKLLDTSAQFTFAVLLLMDGMAVTDGISRVVGLYNKDITLSLDKDNIKDYINARGRIPNAVNALTHFLCGNGEDYEFEKYPYAIAMTNNGRNKYYDNMNAFFDMVEKNIMIDRTYDFSTVKDINKPEDANDTWRRPEWKCDFSGGAVYNINASSDWWLAFGGCQTALSSTVSCHKDNGDIVYTAKIRYYAIDVYDFENDKLEKALHRLNNTGWGRTYISYGCYETKIEWVKGSRYQRFPTENDENCKTVVFKGITDSNLSKIKDEAEVYYAVV